MESKLANHQAKAKRKLSKTEKELKMQKQRQKLSEMIDGFYEKSRHKIQKSLNKQNRRVSLLYKELLLELAQQPKQELFQISRINDEIFNQMNKLNSAISDFLKIFENLKDRVSKEVEIQKGKNETREEKQNKGEYDIAVLRKINLKKQKTCLTHKLKDIESLNKKLVKFEAELQGETTGSIEIDGKRVEGIIHKYKKVWFETKKKEYLLCLTSKQNEREGNLVLYSDKLQIISQFAHLPLINLQSFREIIQIEHILFLVHSHQVIKIDLTNQFKQSSQVFKQRINKAQQFEGTLILWMQDEHSNHYLLFLTSQLQTYFQDYLRMNVKSIGAHFKLINQYQEEELYFVGRTSTGSSDLFKIVGTEVSLVLKDIGSIDQVVECKSEGKVRCVLLRRNGQLFRFTTLGTSEKLFHIDIENGESMQKCCILGQNFYALHQSGKSLLQCHFKMERTELNPQP